MPDPGKPIPSGVAPPSTPEPAPAPSTEPLQVEEAPPEKPIQVKAAEPVAATATTPEEAPDQSLEDARRKIGPEALQVLKERFNGKLTNARQPDERDQLF
jgi:hypothetical protein